MWKWCERLLLALSPLVAVLVVTAFSWRPIMSGSAGQEPPGVGPDSPPIVLMLFDEWSWTRARDGSSFRRELQHARSLSARATTFIHAASPGTATFVSVPRILFGSDGYLAREGDRPYWQPHNGPATETASTWSILSAATQAGYGVSGAGFYLPLGELTDPGVANVWSMPSTPKYRGVGGSIVLTFTKAFRSFADPVLRTAGHYAWMRQWQLSHVRLNQRVQARAVDLLRGLRAGEAVWVHLPVPHAPFVFDRDGAVRLRGWQGRQESDSLKYLDHLIYADKVLGRLLGVLDSTQMLERAMIVVTSDHGWRTDPRLTEATSYRAVTSVPLIVKWPHQAQAARVEQPMCLSALQQLLGPVERGDTIMPSEERIEQIAGASCNEAARARDSIAWHATPQVHR